MISTARWRLLAGSALTALALLWPEPADAQARVLVTPSISAGVLLDDNLFMSPKTLKASDSILRFTPGLTVSRESARNYWFGTYSFDADRYRDHPSMTTPLARQSATAFGRIGVSPVTTVTLLGGYDTTVTPTDFNLTTGLLAGYTKAWRWHAGPEFRHALSAVTSFRLSYDVSQQGLSDQRIDVHSADFRLAHALGARDELRVEPFVRQFVFFENDSYSVASAGGTLGWTRRLTPVTNLSLQGGPRFTQGIEGVKPELDVLLRRRTAYTELSAGYTRTSTTALGLRGIAETERVSALAGYRRPAVLDVSVGGDMYVNEIADVTSRVYRISTAVLRAITPGFSISMFYSFALQRGLLPMARLVTNPELAAGRGELVAAPLALMESTALEVPLRRNVLGVKIVISPTFHPTRLPPAKVDPPADASSSGSIR